MEQLLTFLSFLQLVSSTRGLPSNSFEIWAEFFRSWNLANSNFKLQLNNYIIYTYICLF